jgi:hypothetical protein
VLLLACSCGGCGSRPGRVATPKVDAQAAGNAAVTEYDRDGNGALDEAELKNCRALWSKRGEIDGDHNAQLSADEIADRIAAWQKTRVGFITGYKCKVLLDGKPLSGAVVDLVPEKFLGENIKPASGAADNTAIASLAVADSELPADLRGIRGVHYGLYRVKISHPTKTLPEQYVNGTELGCEIYPIGDPEFLTYNVRTK